METSPTFLLRKLITYLFFQADKFQHLRRLLVFYYLHIITISAFSFTTQKSDKPHVHNPPNTTNADSGIARALSQLLTLVNDIPVNSRKYEVVRSLSEKLIDDNLNHGFDVINKTVLSAAFERTVSRLEAAVLNGTEPGYLVNRALRAVRSFGGDVKELGVESSSAEKLAAEGLWLVQKLEACGYLEEAVARWASASNLAWMSLSAEPRVQGSLVKLSAFLFKKANDLAKENEYKTMNKQAPQRETNLKLLTSWLPLLCRASNGTDSPILSSSERAELERVLEEMIYMLDEEKDQEKILSLWLHHFTYSASSDWPNLHACYDRWCTASRNLLRLH